MGNCQQFNPKDQVKSVHKLQPISLLIKHYTWNRDSHGLFDYENKNILKGQLKSNLGLIRLVRLKDDVKLKEETQSTESQELLQIVRKPGRFQIESVVSPEKSEESEGLQENCPWIVVKSLKQKENFSGYQMVEGDYIKLGRVRFRIREIKSNNYQIQIQSSLDKVICSSNIQVLDKTRQVSIQDDDNRSRVSQSQQICRICLGESEIDNPLVDACNCQGSVKYIHIKCLQKWLGNKLNPKMTKFSVSFVWKKFECEICKHEFPNVIKQNGLLYETVEIPKPQPPFITLEILSRERNLSKGTHIISLAHKSQIKLGRGHDSDVRITDISVSRFHAIIKFFNDSFYLEDNKSKFGTLVLMRKQTNLSVEENNNIAVQVGRSVISFQVKKEWKAGSCCMGGPLTQDPDADEVIRTYQKPNKQMNQQQTLIQHIVIDYNYIINQEQQDEEIEEEDNIENEQNLEEEEHLNEDEQPEDNSPNNDQQIDVEQLQEQSQSQNEAQNFINQ